MRTHSRGQHDRRSGLALLPSHAKIGLVLFLAFAVLPLGGCAVGALIGGMASSAERSGSKDVKARYTKLEGKSFAVIVAADRSIQGDQPNIVPMITREVTRRIIDNCGAGGVVPAEDVLRFQYQRPGWVAMSPLELAKEFEVDRLIFIDLQDYSLSDPGNPYIWNGSASGTLNVLESDSKTPADFAFRETIRVKYPDSEGLSPLQLPKATVELELARRFVARASWMFFDHEEPNIIKY